MKDMGFSEMAFHTDASNQNFMNQAQRIITNLEVIFHDIPRNIHHPHPLLETLLLRPTNELRDFDLSNYQEFKLVFCYMRNAIASPALVFLPLCPRVEHGTGK